MAAPVRPAVVATETWPSGMLRPERVAQPPDEGAIRRHEVVAELLDVDVDAVHADLRRQRDERRDRRVLER